MPVKPLPANPNLDHLKHQAKDLIRDRAGHDSQAAQRIREFHPRFKKASDGEIFAGEFALGDAQLTIARERGFPSWARLKRHIEQPSLADNLRLPHHERIEDPAFRRAVDLLDAGDAGGLQLHLADHPELVHQRVVFEGGNYFRNPSLLEFIAENPVRRGSLPADIVEVAKVILDAGAKDDPGATNEALGLVASGRVPRECLVQVPLIDLLCQYGADAGSAVLPALSHGEFAAVEALMRHRAELTLPVAAGLGRIEDARRLLPEASSEDRHRALALASQFGHVAIVRMLLDAGEDPNRYNPPGSHAHSTPLHQAALAGHRDVAALLIDRGARLDIEDTLWQGTPAGWAKHEGRTEMERYLRAREPGI